MSVAPPVPAPHHVSVTMDGLPPSLLLSLLLLTHAVHLRRMLLIGTCTPGSYQDAGSLTLITDPSHSPAGIGTITLVRSDLSANRIYNRQLGMHCERSSSINSDLTSYCCIAHTGHIHVLSKVFPPPSKSLYPSVPITSMATGV